MQKKENFCFKELPIALVEEDPDQPRKNLEEDIEHLMHSIQSIGMQQPIVVWAMNKGSRYIIIDGHRRYKAAVKLGKENIWCRVLENEKMKRGEFEYCRYEIQNNKKEWQPLERANCLSTIKKENSLSSNRELAEFLGLASSTVSYSLRVLDLTVAYMSLMEEFKLTETYRTEYIRIRSKLRKVRDKEISDITRVLFQKARDRVITEAKNFRRLAPIFLRSEQNQEQILTFLNDPDMTIDELEERTRRFAPAVTAEKLIVELARLLEAGEELPKEERKVFVQLQELCKSILSPRKHAAPVLARA